MVGLLDDFNPKANPIFARSDWREIVKSSLSRFGLKDDALIDAVLDSGGSIGSVLGLGPEHVAAFVQIGADHLAKGRADDALNAFGFAAMIDPMDHRAYFGLASVMQAKGDFKTAAQNYVMAMTLEPHFPFGYLRLGECHMAAKEFARAKECFETAKKIAVGHADAPKIDAQADRMLAVIAAKN